jgi:hypothetical protein
VRPHLNAKDEGKLAAIDIESGSYEVDEDELVAGDKLRARLPEAQIWMVRVGSRVVRRMRTSAADSANVRNRRLSLRESSVLSRSERQRLE